MNYELNLRELVRKASSSGGREFSTLVEKVTAILTKERAQKKIGEQIIEGGLVHLPGKGKVLVVGDLHGDLQSLIFILEESNFIEKRDKEALYLVFLGDYGDRGEESPEVYYLILTLKSAFREKIILLRGNHEGPKDLEVRPHDLPYFLREKYGNEGRAAYTHLQRLFDSLHHSVIINGKYLMLHGGLPEGLTSLDEIAYAHDRHPSKKYQEEILWSDPGEVEEGYPSPRGAGRIFGRKLTMNVLSKLGVKTLIRSHQPCQGALVSHGGKVLTLFSRKGSPYYNSQAAYLEIDLSKEAKSGYELAKKAHRF